ncbi:hypothetical protein FHX64_000483 [Microbacter margulisiae]|uniref:Uncharacterized protein n=1 Tax=Microbacter margulisiae TaxID=1350067 RepID=A0A7W5H142_9PORP|nr:hypothetical protein [Microbacter margulisiae]
MRLHKFLDTTLLKSGQKVVFLNNLVKDYNPLPTLPSKICTRAFESLVLRLINFQANENTVPLSRPGKSSAMWISLLLNKKNVIV